MTEVQDPVVRAALRHLVPPAPREGFWEELVERLEAEDPAVPDAVWLAAAGARTDSAPPRPAKVVTLERPDPEEPHGRWRRFVLGTMAAAAIVLAIVAFATRDTGPGEVRTTDPAMFPVDQLPEDDPSVLEDPAILVDPAPESPSTTAEPGADPTSSAPPTEPPAPAGSDPRAEEAEEVVLAWVAAADQGDVRAAWELLGPESRQMQDQAGLERLMKSALREGWGAWAYAEDLAVTVVPLAEVDGEQLWVVELSGVVPQEGPPAPARVAIVARTPLDGGSGQATVEPFIPGAAAGVVAVPLPGEPFGGSIPLGIEAGNLGYVVMVDGQVQSEPALEIAPGGAVTAWRPVVPLPAGSHTVTVAYVARSGAPVMNWATFEID